MSSEGFVVPFLVVFPVIGVVAGFFFVVSRFVFSVIFCVGAIFSSDVLGVVITLEVSSFFYDTGASMLKSLL